MQRFIKIVGNGRKTARSLTAEEAREALTLILEGSASPAQVGAFLAALRGYIDQAIAEARKNGESRTLFGRVRAMPEIASRNPALRMAAERTAINTPIQGTAADIVKIAMLRVHAAIEQERRDARLLLQVHDELVLEVGEKDLAPVEALVKREMEGAATLEVPLDVEVGHGRSWAEAH